MKKSILRSSAVILTSAAIGLPLTACSTNQINTSVNALLSSSGYILSSINSTGNASPKDPKNLESCEPQNINAQQNDYSNCYDAEKELFNDIKINNIKSVNLDLGNVKNLSSYYSSNSSYFFSAGSFLNAAIESNAGSKIINDLIRHGANLNYANKPPLIVAVQSNNVNAVNILIDKKVNVNIIHNSYLNPTAPTTALMYAATQGNPIVVKALLKAGADVNTASFYGITPLMYAVQNNNNLPVIKILINAGANVNAETTETASGNIYEITPLMFAASNTENPAVIQTLLNAGANINATDSQFNNIIYYASQNNTPEALTIYNLLKNVFNNS